jgi:GNAT superfamily N-acetyltransferase
VPGLFGNVWLARRLERAEAENVAAWRDLDESGAVEALEIGGGFAVFGGPTSPLTHALGLGMYGHMAAEELDRVESYYRERGSHITIELCPFADPSMFELLGARGYRITEFNNILVRTIDPPPGEISNDVRRAEPSEESVYARTVSEGFFEHTDFTPEQLSTTSTLFRMPCGAAWLAFVDGAAAGAAGMSMRDGLALFFGDATIKAYRRRGIQSDLIKARIAYAAGQGCDLITASTLPGSQSQLNYERLGFRVIYTKLIFTAE